ncbi:DNA-binding transcriptional LysR family regulator [Rhizobium azibense]|uniref:HTH-type transcriptional regulator TtuA n=1 Tax=Rhizobium azibense TaxID=1136135 RepID=A0A4R3R2H5_9HYPH|nr:LysR family transcriptional regulator [Rhizobium azibense]TCU29193.1 DNA-binding transcriptional LysR family regulator [Rhizobium azibense]
MDFPSLRVFLSVAEHRSVTRAAAALGRVASNVTTRIQQLEEDFGVLLFNRDGRQMTLTREGRLFLSYAKRMAALADEARHSLSASSRPATLRVGTMESTAASRLPHILPRFATVAPHISLRLTMGATRDLARAVLAEEVDCALIALPIGKNAAAWLADVDLCQLELAPLWSEEVLIILPPDHPPVRHASDITVGALAALEAGCTYRRMAEDWLGRLSPFFMTIEMSSYHAVIASVLAGGAVGVAPASVLSQLQLSRDMVQTVVAGSAETALLSRKNGGSSELDIFRTALLSAGEDNP